METTTDTTTEARHASRSKQTTVPGTEAKASKKLRDLVEERAIALYEAKSQMATVEELNSKIVALMKAERVEEISCEIEVDDEMRKAVTRLKAGEPTLQTKLAKKPKEE